MVKPGDIVGVALESCLDDPGLDAKWIARDEYSLLGKEKLPTRINSTKQLLIYLTNILIMSILTMMLRCE